MRPRDLLRDLVAITRRARRKPARERDKTMTQTIATLPDASTALWVNAGLGGPVMWHAVKAELAGDRALTHCGKRLELTGETQEVRAGVVPVSACGVCEMAFSSTPAIPELPGVLWFKAQSGQPVMHAAKARLEDDLVRTYCGDVLDFPTNASELRLPSLYAGSCALCELELKKVGSPRPRAGKQELSEAERAV